MPQRPVLGGVGGTALVVVGADDAYTPVAHAHDLYELLPHTTLAVIDRAGHLPNLEQPEDFNDALLAFPNPAAPRGVGRHDRWVTPFHS